MTLTGERKREYQRDWIAARRQEWIDEQGGACVECGGTESLEIDHIDRSEKCVPIASLWSRNKEVREAELVKCQVLCAQCHQDKTSAESLTDHGTIGRYKRGCKCEDCKGANSIRVRKMRARNTPA